MAGTARKVVTKTRFFRQGIFGLWHSYSPVIDEVLTPFRQAIDTLKRGGSVPFFVPLSYLPHYTVRQVTRSKDQHSKTAP